MAIRKVAPILMLTVTQMHGTENGVKGVSVNTGDSILDSRGKRPGSLLRGVAQRHCL
jgi:hypothetical protein